MKEIKLNIEGMKCEGCMNRIKRVISNIEGIEEYDISLENKTLTFKTKNEEITEKIIELIESLGFTCRK